MSRYIFTPSARKDFKEINSYLIRYSASAARIFKERVKKQCEYLADFPQMGRNCGQLMPGLRSFPIDDYLIFYCCILGQVVLSEFLMDIEI